MEGEEIGRVLARASELRARISNCIDRSGGNRGGGGMVEDEEAEQEEEEEEESLLGVCDALESLERQLAALHERILVTMNFKLSNLPVNEEKFSAIAQAYSKLSFPYEENKV